jgi:hypothetical protein
MKAERLTTYRPYSETMPCIQIRQGLNRVSHSSGEGLDLLQQGAGAAVAAGCH